MSRISQALLVAAALLLALAPAAGARRNAYLTINGSDQLRAYDLDPASGALSEIAGSPYSVPGAPTVPGVGPTGRQLYVPATFSGDVHGYSLDPGSGAPTEAPGSPVPTGGVGPNASIASPDGKFAFIPNSFSSDISALATGADGSLTAIAGSPFATGSVPTTIAIEASGDRLYVPNLSANTFSGYDVDDSGSLTPIAGSPFAVPATGPVDVELSPDGQRLYVANQTSGNILVYSLDDAGVPTLSPGTPELTSGTPNGIAITPDGRRLYVANGVTQTIDAYSIDSASGELTVVAGSPFAAGGNDPFDVVIAPSGRNLYVPLYSSGGLAMFGIDGTSGSLTPLAGSPLATGGLPYDLAITPDQAPTASFAASVAGRTASFDASASQDADGSVASYSWDFGDGATARTDTPNTTHAYAGNGNFAASLTVTDDEGCSTRIVTTGQTIYCNGNSGAAAAHTVAINQLPTISDLKAGRRLIRNSRTRAGARRRYSRSFFFDFDLSAAATVRIALDHRTPGRLVRGRCVVPRRGNRSRRRCGLSYSGAGTIAFDGKAGANSSRFNGKIGSTTLATGVYRATMTATDASGAQSQPSVAFLKIAYRTRH